MQLGVCWIQLRSPLLKIQRFNLQQPFFDFTYSGWKIALHSLSLTTARNSAFLVSAFSSNFIFPHNVRNTLQKWADSWYDTHHENDHLLITWTEAWDSHKLQVPGLSYNWWGFQAWDILQDSTDNSSTDKAETSLDWQEYFSQLQDMTDALPCHIHLPVCLWIMNPHSRAPKKNTSHGNEVLPQDTTHLIQRPCSQRGSLCQGPAGNWTTWRPPDQCNETQTAVVWSCLPFIRSGQNHLAKHSERGKKTRQTEGEVGTQL